MIEITGYKQIPYKEFQDELGARYKSTGMTLLQLTQKIKVKSIQTAKNVFVREMQMVSDEVLTKTMKSVGLDGLVTWMAGKKYFYIKNK